MALTIKNAEVERLVAEVAKTTGESKTEAIRRAMLERKRGLAFHHRDEDRHTRLLRFLKSEVWPQVPSEALGKQLSREEEEAILGYGPEGV